MKFQVSFAKNLSEKLLRVTKAEYVNKNSLLVMQTLMPCSNDDCSVYEEKLTQFIQNTWKMHDTQVYSAEKQMRHRR